MCGVIISNTFNKLCFITHDTANWDEPDGNKLLSTFQRLTMACVSLCNLLYFCYPGTRTGDFSQLQDLTGVGQTGHVMPFYVFSCKLRRNATESVKTN